MIRYTLVCAEGHRFDSWFQSAAAFEKLHSAGHVACASCGSASVEKSLMAPNVRPGRTAAADTSPAQPLKQTASEAEKALAALKAHVEANSDYVGSSFASEARAMYLGEREARAIWGEAKPEEAKSLIEDGVPVAPLPFVPTRKSN